MLTSCLDEDDVNDLAAGLLEPARAEDARLHLDSCPSCRRLVAAAADSGEEPTQPSGEPLLPIGKGTAIGRYLVTDVLGAGGMGAVYAGYDPELQRQVAIKLLHDRSGSGEESLREEARTMARLVHANVVRIYDVGVDRGRTFIAMELLDGRSLRRWLREAPRDASEIVAAFAAAGRGLAAAHDAGILHGDFKPDNVFMTLDGRASVGDFGLARRLDRAGADLRVGGTPAYVAPELLEGKAPTPASDQYSFCVSLRDALPANAPRRLKAILERGLDPEPLKRHASMAALLEQLERPRQKRWLLGLAATAVAAAAVIFGFSRMSRCTGAAVDLAQSIGLARRTALADAFHRAGQDASWAVVEKALAAFSSSWVDVHTRSCRATRIEGHQSEEVLERRARCLAGQREVVGALGELWLKAPPELLSKAPLALASLPLPSSCGGDGPLNAEKLASPAPAIAEKVDSLRQGEAAVTARLAAGDPATALSLARDLSQQAKEVAYAPVEAEALLGLSRALRDHGELDAAEHSFQDATLAAVAARHEQILAESLVQLAQLVSVTRARLDDGEVLISRATPVVAHLGDRKLSVDLEMVRGQVRLQRGDAKGAKEILARQLPVLESIARADHPSMGDLHHSLFMVAHRLGQNEEARDEAAATLHTLEETLPPGNLKIVPAVMDVATVDAELGELSQAHLLFERAIGIAEKNQGPDGSAVAPALANYGSLLAMEGDLAAAHAATERALRIATAVRGPSHPLTAHLEMTLGEMDWKAGDVPAALTHLGLAVQRREEHFGRRHADTAEALAILGRAKLDAGDPGGLALVLEADALVRELSPNARRRAHTASHACEALLEAGKPDEAAPYCERMFAAAREEWPADDPRAIEALALFTSLELRRGGNLRRPELTAAVEAMEKRHGAWPRTKIAAGFALAQVLAREQDPSLRAQSAALARDALELAERLGTRQRRLSEMKEL